MDKIVRIIEKTTNEIIFVSPAKTLNTYDEAWESAVKVGVVNAMQRLDYMIVIVENLNSNML